ncbi:HNH endonuclease [Streptomyces sp. URMC 124]|uniref:HNH endonuclease n=1 Tax=Streptomyces sp. URMC 124 TaxID=3423405 RepID=UPI003F1E151C
MAWSTSTRRAQLPRNWAQLRAAVLLRDAHLCRWVRYDTGLPCFEEATEVDHRFDPHDHRPEALWSLCHWHHARKTAQEAAAGRKRARQAREVPSSRRPHPGAL